MDIIAVDCGASLIKGAVIESVSGKIVEERSIKTPQQIDKTINHLDATLAVVMSLIKDLSYNMETFCLCIANEMHGFVVADEEGTPFVDYVSWQNESSLEAYQESVGSYLDYVKKVLPEEEVLKTGMPLRAGLPSVNLFYYREKKLIPDNQRVYFYTLGDYLIRKISGQQPFIHPTNAAGTGIFDIERNCWNEIIIKKLKLEFIIFPEAGNENNIIECYNMGKNICILPAIGDQQAALFGAGLQKEGELSVNFGTGAQLSVITSKFGLSGGYETRPYFQNLYLHTIPYIPSGRAINVFYRFVKDILNKFTEGTIDEEKIWHDITESASMQSENDLHVDLSFYDNAASDKVRGSIYNISEENLLFDNLFHSIYRQITENILVLSQRLIAGNSCEKIIFTGGVVTKNRYLQENIAEALHVPLHDVIFNETFKGLRRYSLLAMDAAERVMGKEEK